MGSLGRHCRQHREDRGDGVRWHRQQLGLPRGVPELFDDGGEEERQRVKRQAHGVKAHPVQPDFGIAYRFPDVCPRKRLVPGGIRVGAQPLVDVSALIFGQKFRGGRVINNEEVRDHRDHHGQNAFQDENPPPPVQTADASHVRNALLRA